MTELSNGEPSAVVRRVDEDHAVVVGTAEAVAWAGTPAPSVPEMVRRALLAAGALAPALATAAGSLVGEVVRLTPEARALLARHGPVSGGNGSILGVVRGADGRFVGVLGFEPVGWVTRLGPSLPVLLATVALQAQLASVERRLADLQVDVDAIIRDGQVKTMAGARAALEILDDVYGDLMVIGELTPDDWERVVPLELPLRALHQEAAAHLQDLERMLAGAGPGLTGRIQVLRNAVRHGRAEFWLQAYVAAVAALARWEYIRLARLAARDDAKLAREVAEAEESLSHQRAVIVDLAHRLTGLLADAGRVDGLLQRLRLLARAHLERLIIDLDEVLGAYRQWGPGPEGTAPGDGTPAALLPGTTTATLPAPGDDLTWSKIVDQLRMRPGSVARRAGHMVGKAGLPVIQVGRGLVRRLPIPAERNDPGDEDETGPPSPR